jgi:hypothetical protein
LTLVSLPRFLVAAAGFSDGRRLMKAGSGVDERQIAQLWRRVYVRRRLTGRLRLDVDTVAELAATRSVLALPRLVELVLEHRVRDLVAHAIVAIVEEADPMRLAAADAQVRRGSGWNDLWARMTPASFEHHVEQCRDPMGVVLAGGMCRTASCASEHWSCRTGTRPPLQRHACDCCWSAPTTGCRRYGRQPSHDWKPWQMTPLARC